MLAYIYRLIRDFEQEHGIHPNLLFMNQNHCDHLKEAFDNRYSLYTIMQILQMELVIDSDAIHPHAAWHKTAQRRMAS